MVKDTIMVGAGDFAEANVYLFKLEKRLLQYYDDPREEDETKGDFPVSKTLPSYLTGIRFVSTIGDTRHRRVLVEELDSRGGKINWVNLISPEYTIIHESVKMGIDNVIQPLMSIRPFVELGNHNLICGQTNIGHHSIIGDYCTLSPKTTICGNVRIGNGVFLGAGCVITPRMRIGEGSVIGAGAVVTREVPPNQVWGGVPAKQLNATVDHW